MSVPVWKKPANSKQYSWHFVYSILKEKYSNYNILNSRHMLASMLSALVALDHLMLMLPLSWALSLSLCCRWWIDTWRDKGTHSKPHSFQGQRNPVHCALLLPKYMEIVYEIRKRICVFPSHPQPLQWSFFLFVGVTRLEDDQRTMELSLILTYTTLKNSIKLGFEIFISIGHKWCFLMCYY